MLGVADDLRTRLGRLLGSWLALTPLRDSQELGDTFRELRDLLGEARDQGAQLGVVAEQLLAFGDETSRGARR